MIIFRACNKTGYRCQRDPHPNPLPKREREQLLQILSENRKVFSILVAWSVGLTAIGFSQEEAPTTTVTAPETAAATMSDAKEAWLSGDYDKAKKAYTELAANETTRIDASLGLARCRIMVGEYEDAFSELKSLNAEQSADWHVLMAELHRVQGNYDDVLKHARAAIEVSKAHTGARLLLANMLEELGRRDEAIQAYAWFDKQMVERKELPRDAEWVTNIAQGFLRYSTLTKTNLVSRTKHVLNDMLQTAYGRLDRSYWPARLVAGDLLREKYNNDEDDGSISDYQAALKINSKLAAAYVGLGEISLENWDFEGVDKKVEKALEINPKYAPALHLLAAKFIVERRYQQSIETADKAIAMNANDITALSIRAAASACRFDQPSVDAIEARVRAINPRCAKFYRTLGDALGGIRQYSMSEAAYRKAIELEPTDANAHAELGMMYMQWGLEDRAQSALDAAWSLDPFNERTKFTLDLLDMLKKFAKFESKNFIIRYDESSDPGLGEYIAGYLEDIYKPVTEDYDSPLTEKTIIEIFPSHKGFSVRIAGRPWIPTVGACSGRVIALASPRGAGDLMGTYNIARVLKHEFTHTVTLAATNNRIPHWFTEGLAVYQEDAPRSFDWVQLLADAIRRDELFGLESIDWGFMRPRKATDRTMAYAQSEWMCEYIVERFGYDIINRMLARYREGETQAQVFQEVLKIELADFDRDFKVWAKNQAQSWKLNLTPPEDIEALAKEVEAHPDDAKLLGRYARAQFDDGDPNEALTAARKALDIDPKEPNGLEIVATTLAHFAEEEGIPSDKKKYEEEAVKYLTTLQEVAPDNPMGAKLMGEIALRREEWDRATDSLSRLQRIWPIDPLSWRGLAGIYLEKGEDEKALLQLLELARMEERDADVAAKIAKIYRKQGKLRDAQHWFRQAIYIAPLSAELHGLLGDTSMQVNDTANALREYKMVTALEPNKAGGFEKAAAAANKLGQLTEAREFAKKAVAIDPASSAKSLLGE